MGDDQTSLQIAADRHTRHQQQAGCDLINLDIIIELAGHGKPPSPVENLDVVFVARPGCAVKDA
jgi:hypothetical protein